MDLRKDSEQTRTFSPDLGEITGYRCNMSFRCDWDGDIQLDRSTPEFLQEIITVTIEKHMRRHHNGVHTSVPCVADLYYSNIWEVRRGLDHWTETQSTTYESRPLPINKLHQVR